MSTPAIDRRWPRHLAIALVTCLSLPVGLAAAGDLESERAEAASGDPKALVRLAERYETADGVPFDLAATGALLELAAERGDPAAQYRLGLLQAGGLDSDADLAEAYGWLRLAAQSDQDGPSGLLAEAISQALAERLDGAAIERAEQRVAAFQPTSGPALLPAISGELVDDQTSLLALLPATRCGRPEIRRGEDGATVLLAYAPAGSMVDAVITPGIRSDLARRGAALDVAELSPAICGIRDITAALTSAQAATDVTLDGIAADGPVLLHDGDKLVIDVAAASAPRYVAVDYVVHTGEVLHLYPDAGGDGYLPAGQSLRLGDGTLGAAWEVGAPFGEDLVLVTLSTVPASANPAFSERTDSYRARLQQRVAAARADDSLRLFERVVTVRGS